MRGFSGTIRIPLLTRRNFNEETLMDVWAKLNVGDCGRAHKVFVYSKDG